MTLPIRSKLLHGESLFSYLLRLSESNGDHITSFCNLFLKSGTYLQLRNVNIIDFYPHRILDVSLIYKATGEEMEKLERSTFTPILSTYFKGEKLENAKLLGGLVRDELAYCPLCLKEHLYYKLIWKVRPVMYCLDHHQVLYTTCFRCHHPIYYHDIMKVGICPMCQVDLRRAPEIREGLKNLDDQKWLVEQWNFLVYETSQKLDDTIYRVLFILNSEREILDVGKVDEKSCKQILSLVKQVKRDRERVPPIRLSTILTILYVRKLTFQYFHSLQVPPRFIESIFKVEEIKAKQYSCIAPWCKQYGIPSSLQKKSTTSKKRKDGLFLKYYLFCDECGCEFALDQQDRLVERTYFIHFYRHVKSVEIKRYSMKELTDICSMSVDQVKRSLAYFHTRGFYLDFYNSEVVISKAVVKLFISMLERGKGLKEIRALQQWNQLFEYLMYRYHIEVMREIQKPKLPPSNHRQALHRGKELIKKTLEHMLERDVDITLETVAVNVGVSVTTIRNWNGNTLVAEAKESQQKERLLKLVKQWEEEVERFFLSNRYPTSKQVYKWLGVDQRSVSKKAPQLSRFIHQKVRQEKQKNRLRGELMYEEHGSTHSS